MHLIAAADSYWRAFQTNGTPGYHRARLLPDSVRFENGLQTTGLVRDGVYNDTARGFDEGRFIGRNIWDRRYPVVDEERGVVLSIVRFGLKGMGIAPAGVKFDNTGHHHLLVDMDVPADLSVPMPATDKLLHFGKGQTQTSLTLTPGKHTLQLVFADLNHVAFNPPLISKKVTITVVD